MDHCVIYLSTATPEFTLTSLEHITQSSVVNNKPMNVTGMLLYSGTHFLQILEGNKDMLEVLLKHIHKDSRHTDIEIVMSAPIEKRMFAEWHMGVLDISGHKDLDREQFKFIAQQAQCDPATAGRAAVSILKQFRNELPDPYIHLKSKRIA